MHPAKHSIVFVARISSIYLGEEFCHVIDGERSKLVSKMPVSKCKVSKGRFLSSRCQILGFLAILIGVKVEVC